MLETGDVYMVRSRGPRRTDPWGMPEVLKAVARANDHFYFYAQLMRMGVKKPRAFT